MAKIVKCPNCEQTGQISPSDGTFDIILGHRLSGKILQRCPRCMRGMTLGFFSGLMFGSPSPVPEELWQIMALCIDDAHPIPPEIICTPISVEPGFAYQWDTRSMSSYSAWRSQLQPNNLIPNELAGIRIGSAFNPNEWQIDGTTYGRELIYCGHNAIQIVGTNNGRISFSAITLIISHPLLAGFGSIIPNRPHSGITASSDIESTANAIKSDILSLLEEQGFKLMSDVHNPKNPDVEHYCAKGRRERTLLVNHRDPGKMSTVSIGIPPESNCPE